MLNTEHLTNQFKRIGAELEIRHVPTLAGNYDLNIIGQGKRERFFLRVTNRAPEFRVLQANPLVKHLLLYAPGLERITRITGARLHTKATGDRLLCGHDERHWFVAAIADRVSTVNEAKRSLLPLELRDAGITPDHLARRHNEVFKRQGEWFFVPATRTDLGQYPIHHQEPIMRNRRSKPHICAELVRVGGKPVVLWNGREYTVSEWDELVANSERPRQQFAGARQMVKDAQVYVRGAVRHGDHATLILPDWHRVYANVEAWSESVSFYD